MRYLILVVLYILKTFHPSECFEKGGWSVGNGPGKISTLSFLKLCIPFKNTPFDFWFQKPKGVFLKKMKSFRKESVLIFQHKWRDRWFLSTFLFVSSTPFEAISYWPPTFLKKILTGEMSLIYIVLPKSTSAY